MKEINAGKNLHEQKGLGLLGENFVLKSVENDSITPSPSVLNNSAVKADLIRQARFLWKNEITKKYMPQNNPVSLERRDIKIIEEKDFFCTYKSDGINFYLLLTRVSVPNVGPRCPIAVMINRAEEMFEVEVHCKAKYFDGSLFLGELLLTHENKIVYQIYDLVATAGVSLHEQHFDVRYAHLKSVIQSTVREVDDFHVLTKPDSIHHHPFIPFSAEYSDQYAENNRIVLPHLMTLVKEYFPKSDAKHILARKAALNHDIDGLIFVPVESPLIVGRQRNLFKYKSIPTLDFQLDILTDTYELYYSHNGSRLLASDPGSLDLLTIPPVAHPIVCLLENNGDGNEIFQQLKQQHAFMHHKKRIQVIVECTARLCSDQDVLFCFILRVRYDKSAPNDRMTLEGTIRNIMEDVQSEELAF